MFVIKNFSKGIPALVLTLFFNVLASSADPISPKDAYFKYRTALAKADKIEDLQSMLCKKVNEEIEHTPSDMKPMMFGLMKATTPSSVQVLSEEIKDNNATLILSGKTEPDKANIQEKTTGKVTFVKENEEWKIDKESWNSKVEIH